jgi:Zn-dependent peptidase ImmA (M78 family)
VNIPSKVKIGGRGFTVYKTLNPLLVSGIECGGTIEYENSLISLNSARHDDAVECHFLHEIIHAICMDRGIKELDDNENFVDSFARGLHAFIKDNPEIFK